MLTSVPAISPILDALATPDPALALRDLDAAGNLAGIIPEIEEGRDFQQPELHCYTVLDHNLAAVAAFTTSTGAGLDGDELRASIGWLDLEESLAREIDGLPLRVLVGLACLLHDVAKPATAIIVEGRMRFPRHGPRGAEMMRARLPEVGLGEEATRLVASLIRYHLRPGELLRAWPATDRAVRKFVNDLEGHVLPLMLVNLADGMATRGPGYTRENYRRHCGFVNYVLARAVSVSEDGEPPLVTGDDLIEELRLESGRLLGAVLTSIRQAQMNGAVRERDDALAFARTVLESLKASES